VLKTLTLYYFDESELRTVVKRAIRKQLIALKSEIKLGMIKEKYFLSEQQTLHCMTTLIFVRKF